MSPNIHHHHLLLLSPSKIATLGFKREYITCHVIDIPLTNQESEPVYAFYLINPAVVIMQPLRAK
jgi:hypothetical protein